MKKETGFACFICPGCGSAAQIAQKSGSSGVHGSKGFEGYWLKDNYACLPSSNLSSLHAADCSVAEPAVCDVAAMYEAADVQITFTSLAPKFTLKTTHTLLEG